MKHRLSLVLSISALAVAILGSSPTGLADSVAVPAKGNSGISGYELVERSSAFDATDGKLVSATCPAGKKVVGGGATANPAIRPIALVHSAAARDGRTWTAIAREYTGNAFPWNLTVRAICANAA